MGDDSSIDFGSAIHVATVAYDGIGEYSSPRGVELLERLGAVRELRCAARRRVTPAASSRSAYPRPTVISISRRVDPFEKLCSMSRSPAKSLSPRR